MADNKGTNVGGIYYEVALDTRAMIDGQRAVDRELKKTSGSLAEFGTKLTAVAGAVGVLVAAIARLKVAELADEIRLLQARVEVAAGSVEQGADAFGRLVDISRRTQTSVAGNIEVFNRLNQSILQMGGTQNDTLQITELLAKAIKVSGASAVEAKNAMVQFGQALGSGKLQGDELRSLMESAPYLMKQLADGIGVPIGALKNLGSEGKLTADVVANALAKSAAKIDADFKKFPQTISGAMQVAQDAAALLALEYDKLSGGSAMVTGASKGLADVLEELAKQFAAANDGATALGRNEAIKQWGESTRNVLSYVADAADLVWQTLSVLGRNVAFVFKGIGTEIGGIGAQIRAVLSGDFAGAKAIHEEMMRDADQRRAELDAADKKTLGRAKLAGQAMREAWEQGAGGGRGFVNPEIGGQPSKLKSAPDDDAARKLKAKAEAAQAYYQGLVAENSLALEKIDAEEKKALAENLRRRAEDKNNAAVYEQARVEIKKKYARERGVVEEQEAQQIAELRIASMTDEVERIAALRDEAFRRADSLEQKGIITAAQAERAKVAAMIAARESFDERSERDAQARAARELAITRDQSAQIDMIYEESLRHTKDQLDRGKISFDEAEAAKTKALQDAIDARKALTQQRDSAVVTTLQYKASTGGTDVQEALIRQQAAVALKATEEARQRDLQSSQIYADQKVAIEADMNRRIADMRASANSAALGATADAFGSILNVMQKAGKEQSGVFQAVFAAQKAFSIAQSIVAIQTGIANAASLPWPSNLAAMASVAAATASIISTIQNTNYGGGRQYGGGVNAGKLYRVNETGESEMYTASNGQQYFLPTRGGQITPADKAMPSAGGAGQGGDTNISISVAVSVQADGSAKTQTGTSGADQATARALGERMAAVTKQTMQEELRPGGLLWRMKHGQA